VKLVGIAANYLRNDGDARVVAWLYVTNVAMAGLAVVEMNKRCIIIVDAVTVDLIVKSTVGCIGISL
jgi:hypothetical protein